MKRMANYSVDVKEASKKLDVSKRTIYNYLQEDKLDGKKVATAGGRERWLINEKEFEEQTTEIVEKVKGKMKREELEEIVEESIAKSIYQYLKFNDQMLQEKVANEIEQSTDQLKQLINCLQEENESLRGEVDKLRAENKELREQNYYCLVIRKKV